MKPAFHLPATVGVEIHFQFSEGANFPEHIEALGLAQHKKK